MDEPKNVTLELSIRALEAKTMSPLLQKVLRQVEQLEPGERLELIQQVAEGLKMPTASQPKLKWSDLKGMGYYPMMGEDAQDWVSRTRREGDEDRERLLRRESYAD